MRKPEIFITIEAFKKFFELYVKYRNSSEDDKKLKNVLKWKDALLERTKIHFNIDIKNETSKTIISDFEPLRVAIKNSVQGFNNIDSDGYEWDKELRENNWIIENPHSIFILDIPEIKCEEIQEDYGQLVLNPIGMIEYGDLLFCMTHLPLKKGHSVQIIFNTINQTKLPCNTIFITDGYVLDKSNEFNSILALLHSIMPEKLKKTTFQIDIVTFDENGILNLSSDRFIKFENDIKSLRNYAIELNIYITRKEQFHDRNIYTNHLWYNSGHTTTFYSSENTKPYAFLNELSNKTIKRDTTINILPILIEENNILNQTSYNTKIEHLNKFKNIIDNHVININKAISNRLIISSK